MELDKEIIECLISVGYELHIHDQVGIYPCGDRDDWIEQKVARCLGNRVSHTRDKL